jgi:hypothetical protein
MSRRQEMIKMLIDSDFDSIQNNGVDTDFLFDFLYSGFKGYDNFTDEELVNEMNERELWTEWFKETV